MNFKMGFVAVSMLVAVLCLPATIDGQSDLHPTNKTSDLQVAMEEMKGSSYYGFVMLLQMLQAEQLPMSQITFFMPSDQALAEVNLQVTSYISELVLRHSVHQPLKFNHLLHFPTGTLIPSSFPNYMLKVSNNGRNDFYLNNVHIVHPNVCRASPSISCHGVSGVLANASTDPYPGSPAGALPAPSPSSQPPPPPPPPASPRNSNSSPPSQGPSISNPPEQGPSIQNLPRPAVSPLSPISNGTGKNSASCMGLVYGSIFLLLTWSTATFLAIAQP